MFGRATFCGHNVRPGNIVLGAPRPPLVRLLRPLFRLPRADTGSVFTDTGTGAGSARVQARVQVNRAGAYDRTVLPVLRGPSAG